jgi:hypothetical protein
MIEFILVALVCENDDPEGNYARLHKKMLWPVLPRTEEWFEVPETESGTASPVGDVWHWVRDDGAPNIHVEVVLRLHDYKKLEGSPLWKEREHDL